MTDKHNILKISFVKLYCQFVKLMSIERSIKVASIIINLNIFAR